MEINGFVGKHVLLDVKSYNKEKLSNIDIMYNYLVGITDLLQMTLITTPIILEFPFSNEANMLAKKLKEEGIDTPALTDFFEKVKRKEKHEAGISGVAIWAESHCSSHTWTENDFNSLDIYSCKDFDHKLAIDYVIKTFDVKSGSVSVIKRYTDIPHEIFAYTL